MFTFACVWTAFWVALGTALILKNNDPYLRGIGNIIGMCLCSLLISLGWLAFFAHAYFVGSAP